jgi:D-tyrosyl-tRNA(Tyr) deacylase
MRALVQRVSSASVTVGGEVVGAIGPGLCVFVGVTHGDDADIASRLAAKVAALRVFDDEAGVMNRSVLDAHGSALVVSQFTLYGDTRKGRRPSWVAAARPEVAEPLVRAFAQRLASEGVSVETGRFRAEMTVSIVNEGPVTVMLELEPAREASQG